MIATPIMPIDIHRLAAELVGSRPSAGMMKSARKLTRIASQRNVVRDMLCRGHAVGQCEVAEDGAVHRRQRGER